MYPSRRRAIVTVLAALAPARPLSAAPPSVLEVQGGQYASFDGAQLFYRRMGKGPPVILLHGFLSDGPRSWFSTGVAQSLAQAGFSVVAPDARAHGLSAAPPGPYPKDVLAMDVEALIHALNLRSYRLFGNAMGSRTAIRLMARGARPERCVLGGTGIRGAVGVEGLANANAETILTGRSSRDPRLGVLVKAAIRLQKLSPAALISVLRSQVSTPAAVLAKIKTPILVLNGETDQVEGDPGLLADLFPAARLERAPGDHITALREPRFASIAAAFLKSRDAPSDFVPPPVVESPK